MWIHTCKIENTYEFSLNGWHNARIKRTQGYIHAVAVQQNRRLLSFSMNNITNKRGKMQYAELAEFSWFNWLLAQVSIKFDYLHIGFPDDDTLSVRSRDDNCKREKIACRNSPYLSISLSIYYFAFFFAKFKKKQTKRTTKWLTTK